MKHNPFASQLYYYTCRNVKVKEGSTTGLIISELAWKFYNPFPPYSVLLWIHVNHILVQMLSR